MNYKTLWVLVLALLFASCGGGGSTGTSSNRSSSVTTGSGVFVAPAIF